MPMHGGSLYHFYDGLWYYPAERQTHDLPYQLSQPDTVKIMGTYNKLVTIHTRSAYSYIHRWKRSTIKNPKNVYFADFHNAFVYQIYPEHGFKNP